MPKETIEPVPKTNDPIKSMDEFNARYFPRRDDFAAGGHLTPPRDERNIGSDLARQALECLNRELSKARTTA